VADESWWSWVGIVGGGMVGGGMPLGYDANSISSLGLVLDIECQLIAAVCRGELQFNSIQFDSISTVACLCVHSSHKWNSVE